MWSTSSGADLDFLPSGIPRAVEAVAAALGILVCSPVLALVAVGVRLTSPGPTIFRQPRVGRNGEAFTLVKFRTMRVNDVPHGVTASGDPRVTPLGRWLRRLKVDELPELWNIARGDMSFVGPRPEVPRYVDLANPAWRAVLRARPGITDPVTLRLINEEAVIASVPGDRERFYLDALQPYKLAGYVEYLKRRTFLSDLGVILRTAAAIVVPTSTPPPSVEEIRAVAAASRRSPGSAKPLRRQDQGGADPWECS
jgi:lipopolysaccharide/colanic/teichoic acid biosynthesis glycosyltransferase